MKGVQDILLLDYIQLLQLFIQISISDMPYAFEWETEMLLTFHLMLRENVCSFYTD